ncbi:NYN domain-containing protein [Amylocystis lapponica]|nr:NYN domain-containing protein [Amylocystis lapponica]
MNDQEDVAIYWDYENCPPPSSISGYDLIDSICQIAHEFGSVKLFKAYFESSDMSSPRMLGFLSELQSSGVSLTNCPHVGRKDVVDKMILVDMLMFAMDTPAPSTIILIAGDRDYVYAVSMLRLRCYRVVLVVPNAVHPSVKRQASVLFDWNRDVLGKLASESAPPCTSNDTRADKHQKHSSVSSSVPESPSIQRANHRASIRETTASLTPSVVHPGSSHLPNTPKDLGRLGTPSLTDSSVNVDRNTLRSTPQTPTRIPEEIPVLQSPFMGRNGETISGLNVNLKTFNDIDTAECSSSGSLNNNVLNAPRDVARNGLSLLRRRSASLPTHLESQDGSSNASQYEDSFEDIDPEYCSSSSDLSLSPETPEQVREFTRSAAPTVHANSVGLSPRSIKLLFMTKTPPPHSLVNIPSAYGGSPTFHANDKAIAKGDITDTPYKFTPRAVDIPGPLPHKEPTSEIVGKYTVNIGTPPTIPVSPRQHPSQRPLPFQRSTRSSCGPWRASVEAETYSHCVRMSH